ncbi:hypothetical protein Ddye_018925 [Dipteronia dyeriana]|uniref:MULE transposase domain-containing protein n=1 Tax=Dipteronia dyeriana TaxID=168575 RepID=A0AAD9TWV0_9ROSI|nr:hypothetical protein Ddye_018925 [Dipteronia dyeriana]
MTYDELMSIVQTVVKYDENKYNSDLQYISIVPVTTCRTFIRNDDDVQFMLGEDRVIPQVCVSLIERAPGDALGEDIPHRKNTQQFQSLSRSKPLLTKRSGIEGRENMCGVPPEVADHADILGPQFDDVFGFQIEMNGKQYNHQYNEIYNDINNYHNTVPNVRLIHEMGNENNENDEEPALTERRIRHVHRFSSSAADIVGTSEIRGLFIAVDDTHLKGRFRGTMFVATAQDENEQGALGHIDDLVFISDRHASIEAGISKVFLYATHTICCWHFAKNIKKRYHRKDVASIMDKAARAYTELKYNQHMEELRILHKNAYDYVIDIGPHKWSRVHYPERRYRVMTINVVECINSCPKFARQLPLLTLAEFIRNMLH